MKRVFVGVLLFVFARASLGADSSDRDLLYDELSARSFPPDLSLVSLTNPWGERLAPLYPLSTDFGRRVVTAAKVYADQKVRYDGYVGSDDDGQHYSAAADGIDAAYYGDEARQGYRLVRTGAVDDLKERVWVCSDYPVHAVTLAGFPLRDAMAAHFEESPLEYTAHGYFSSNRPTDSWFFRRILNVRRYFMQKQFYSEDRVTQAEYRDPSYRPAERYAPGDVLFMGHRHSDDNLGPWVAKHAGIVGTVDERGLPVRIYNMRVSHKLHDNYDGLINQTRMVGYEEKFYKHFSDRYTLIGHGRIVNGFAHRSDPGNLTATIQITDKSFRSRRDWD